MGGAQSSTRQCTCTQMKSFALVLQWIYRFRERKRKELLFITLGGKLNKVSCRLIRSAGCVILPAGVGTFGSLFLPLCVCLIIHGFSLAVQPKEVGNLMCSEKDRQTGLSRNPRLINPPVMIDVHQNKVEQPHISDNLNSLAV